MLSTQQGVHMINSLLQLQSTGNEDVVVEEEKEGVKGARPEWMQQLALSTNNWIKEITGAGTLKALPSGAELEKLVLNPLFRCVKREYDTFSALSASVASDLTLVRDVLADKEDANNRVRALFVDLKKEAMPAHWIKYGGSLKKEPLSVWTPDFRKRIELMAKLGASTAEKYGDLDIWLGGFIAPEAFVAATRQAVAQAHSWSLEELELEVTVSDKSPRVDCFTFTDLELHGADWKDNALAINNQNFSIKLPPTRFSWKKTDGKKANKSVVKVPVYMDSTRSQFLFAVSLARPANIPDEVWSQRGTCLTVWST